MFGLDLAHPVPRAHGPGRGRCLERPGRPRLNQDFRQKWSELLRQIWIGVENRANTSGANPADPSYIALLSRAIKDMLDNRRRGGAARPRGVRVRDDAELADLTVDTDTSVIIDLQATASNPADRLGALGQKVGITPALRSRELFDLSEPMSTLLRGIELGLFDTETTATTLFTADTNIFRDVLDVINNWQSATGERVKERPGSPLPAAYGTSAQPLRVPVPAAAPATGTAAPVQSTTPSANGQQR